jgi:hypothetical protein
MGILLYPPVVGGHFFETLSVAVFELVVQPLAGDAGVLPG